MCTRSTNRTSETRIIPKQTSSIPKTGHDQGSGSTTKPNASNNLIATPCFPELYGDAVTSSNPNSKLSKLLAKNYKKNVGANMSAVRTCTHIKVNGVPCGSPALRGEQFCYFHQRLFHGVRVPNSRLLHTALLENEEAIQVSIMQLVNALLTGTIELKRAEIVLRALNTAVRNARRVRFGLWPDDMVREVPQYEEQSESKPEAENSGSIPAQPPDRTPHNSAHEVRPSATPRPGLPQTSPVTRTVSAASIRVNPAHPKPPASVRDVIKKEVAVGKT